MLRITGHQLEMLGNRARRAFETRVRAHLSACFPEMLEGLDELVIGRRIHDGIEWALKAGWTKERDITIVVDAFFCLGGGDPPQWLSEGACPSDLDPRAAARQLLLRSLAHRIRDENASAR